MSEKLIFSGPLFLFVNGQGSNDRGQGACGQWEVSRIFDDAYLALARDPEVSNGFDSPRMVVGGMMPGTA